jgi:hypothetical protein
MRIRYWHCSEADFLNEIQTKVLRDSQSPLQLCLVISISSNSRNLLHISSNSRNLLLFIHFFKGLVARCQSFFIYFYITRADKQYLCILLG